MTKVSSRSLYKYCGSQDVKYSLGETFLVCLKKNCNREDGLFENREGTASYSNINREKRNFLLPTYSFLNSYLIGYHYNAIHC